MLTVNRVLVNYERILLLHSDAVHMEKGFHRHLDVFGEGGHFVGSFKYLLKWESPHKDRSNACACLSSIPFAQHVRLSLGSFPNLEQRSRARAHANEARRAGSETSQRSLEIFLPKWSSTAGQDEKLHLPPPEVFFKPAVLRGQFGFQLRLSCGPVSNSNNQVLKSHHERLGRFT